MLQKKNYAKYSKLTVCFYGLADKKVCRLCGSALKLYAIALQMFLRGLIKIVKKEGDLMLYSVNDSKFIGYCDFDYRCCFEFFVMLRDHFSCLSEDEEIRNAYECFVDLLYKRIDYPKCSFYADEKVAVFGTL